MDRNRGDRVSRLRRRCERRLRGVSIPQPFDLDAFCAVVAAHRGRPLVLQPMPGLSTGAPCGLWISVPTADYVFYDPETSRLHAEHIVLHELAHMLSGHVTDLNERARSGSNLTSGREPTSGSQSTNGGDLTRRSEPARESEPASEPASGIASASGSGLPSEGEPPSRSSEPASGSEQPSATPRSGSTTSETLGSRPPGSGPLTSRYPTSESPGPGLGKNGIDVSGAALARLVPDLDPRTVQTMLGRVSYTTTQEREAEMLASLIRARAAEPVAPSDLPGRTLSRVADVLKFRP